MSQNISKIPKTPSSRTTPNTSTKIDADANQGVLRMHYGKSPLAWFCSSPAYIRLSNFRNQLLSDSNIEMQVTEKEYYDSALKNKESYLENGPTNFQTSPRPLKVLVYFLLSNGKTSPNNVLERSLTQNYRNQSQSETVYTSNLIQIARKSKYFSQGKLQNEKQLKADFKSFLEKNTGRIIKNRRSHYPQQTFTPGFDFNKDEILDQILIDLKKLVRFKQENKSELQDNYTSTVARNRLERASKPVSTSNNKENHP